jgi:hypothetical protein
MVPVQDRPPLSLGFRVDLVDLELLNDRGLARIDRGHQGNDATRPNAAQLATGMLAVASSSCPVSE